MRRNLFICLMLAGITLALYWPVGRLGFTLYDDWDYVYKNPHVQSGTWEDVKWAFTTSHAGNWHPVTWLSHMLDCQLFGLNAGGHHWINLGFHIVNALLLFVVWKEMTRAVWRSALVAALFAWHPMHVQSVAWISERKDLLSGCFLLLTLWAYARYARRPDLGKPAAGFRLPTSGHYWLALVFFALGLMSKPMLVTVPLVLLLVDFWPLGRISGFGFRSWDAKGRPQGPVLKRLLLEKMPFLALSIISSGLTIWAQQRSEFVVPGEHLPWIRRAPDALVFYMAYLEKLFWPVNLSVYYPYPRMELWEFVCSALVPILLTVLIVRRIRTQPYLTAGWLWFLVMLAPVIGLVQVGTQSIADRYTYLPSIGLFVLVAWVAADFAGVSSLRRTGVTIGLVAALSACLVDTNVQLGYWRNDVTLFRHCVEVTKVNNYPGYVFLGNAYIESGNLAEAARSYGSALQIQPNSGEAHGKLGDVLLRQMKFLEAGREYSIALQLKPEDRDYSTSLQTPTDDAAICKRLEYGLAYAGKMMEMEKKLPGLYAALKTQNTAELHAQIAGIRMERNEFSEALKQYREALQLEPDSPGILNNLAWLLATCPDAAFRDGARAVPLAQNACELTGYKQAIYIGTLAAAYAEAGRFADAIATAQKACALASASGETDLLQKNQQLLELYRAHRTYHPEDQ